MMTSISAPVKAWFLGEHDVKDKRLPHRLEDAGPVELETVCGETGLRILQFDANNYAKDNKFENLKKERGYIRSDIVNIHPVTFADYQKMGDIWYKEHFHPDEEIRFILNGGGYWDFRDINDKWVRLNICKNDFIIIPSGMYHRFTTDSRENCEMMRLFSNTNEWVAHCRPSDDHPVRIQYLKSQKKQ